MSSITCQIFKCCAAELNGQLQFLQETFDSYKSSIEADLKEKWERQKSDINEQHIEEMERHAEQAGLILATFE